MNPFSAMKLSIMVLVSLSSFCSESAQALLSNRLSPESMTRARFTVAKNFVDTEVRNDVALHLDARLAEVSIKAQKQTTEAKEPPMSVETRTVLLKGAFLALQAAAPFKISERDFNRGMSKIINFLADHHTFPQAITIGALDRVTVGEGVVMGGSYGVEGNFYLQGGKLMMSNYRLIGAQAGVGSTTAVTEFYAALCFGSCVGGAPAGWYMGFDGDIAGGLGVGFFLEIGVDVSDLFESYLSKKPYSLQDMYEAAAVYVGFGFEAGVGGGFAGNLYKYDQIGPDTLLANPGQAITPHLISSQSSFLQH